jgi:protein TonB
MAEVAMRKAEAVGLGTSVVLHATVILLFVIAAAYTGDIGRRVVTVVLDGQHVMMGGGSGRGGPRQTPEEGIKRTERAAHAGKRRSDTRPHALPERFARAKETVKEAQTPAVSDFSAVMARDVLDAGGRDPHDGMAGDGGEGQAGGGVGAAGGSGTGGSGRGGGSGEGTGEAGRAAYLKEHFAFIRELIVKNLTYPAIARRMGWKGGLTVSFVICEGGSVENIRIVKSSGHKILDENAVATIKGLQPFPRPPVRAEIVIPIEYRIG